MGICDAYTDLITALPDSIARHEYFNAVILPEGCTPETKALCGVLCPQSASHRTYRRARWIEPAEFEGLADLRLWAFSMYALERLHRFYKGMTAASGPGSRWNATASLNVSDALDWWVVGTGTATVAGDTYPTLVLKVPNWEPPDGGGVESPSARVLSQRRFVPEGSQFYTFATKVGAGIQANDEIEIVNPWSCLYGKCRPTVVAVTGEDRAAGTVTVAVNMDCSNIFWSTYLYESSDLLPYVAVRSWRYSGSQMGKIGVVEAETFQVRELTRVITAADIAASAEGRFELFNSAGASTRINTYTPADEVRGTLATFKATAVTGTTATDWTAALAPGAGRTAVQQVGENSWRTWVCLGTKDWKEEETLASGFTTGVDYVVIRYQAEAVAGDKTAAYGQKPVELACGGRCAWSKRTPGDGNYSMEYGAGPGPGTEKWHCQKRQTDGEQMIVDPDDPARFIMQYNWSITSAPNCLHVAKESLGGARKYFGKSCYQPGTCELWAPIQSAAAGDRMTTLLDVPQLLRGMICGVTHRLSQPLPGFNYWVWDVPPEGQESLLTLAGTVMSLTSRVGKHERNEFPKVNVAPYIGPTTFTTDGSGNAVARQYQGWNWDAAADRSGLIFNDLTTYPGAGSFRDVTSYGVRRHPFTHAPLADANDPYLTIRRHLDGWGYAVEKDTGQIVGRGQEWNSYLEATDTTLFAEDIRTAVTFNGEVQERGDCRVTWLASPITVMPGFTSDLIIDVNKIVEGGVGLDESIIRDRTVEVVRTAEIAEVVDLGSGRWRFVLANVRRTWSWVVTVGIGNSYDLVTYYESGDHFWSVPEFLRPDDYYDEGQKRIGCGSDRAWLGMGIKIGLDPAGIPNFGDFIWAVDGGQPSHPDYPAADWGAVVHSREGVVTGCYVIPESHRYVDRNGDGVVDGDDVDSETGMYDLGQIQVATVTLADELPPGATEVPVTAEAPIAVGTILSSSAGGELLRVTGWLTSPSRLQVARTQLGTAEITHAADTTLTVCPVVGWDSVGGVPALPVYTRVTSDARPTGLTAGQFWIDPDRGVMHFSQADIAAGNVAMLAYSAAGTPQTAAYGRIKTNYLLALPEGDLGTDPQTRYPRFYTGMDPALWDSDPPVVTNRQTGAAISRHTPATYAPPAGSYSLHTEGGVAVLYLHPDQASVPIRVLKETEDRNTVGPGAIAPGFEARGKLQDTVEVTCESGFIAAVAAELPGNTISLVNAGPVFNAEIPEIGAGAYQAATSVEVANEHRLSQHGMGRVWVSPAGSAPIRALGPRICLRIGGEQS